MYKKILLAIVIILPLLAVFFKLFGTGWITGAQPQAVNDTSRSIFPSRTPADVPQTKLYFKDNEFELQSDGTYEAEVYIDTGENRVTAVRLEIGYDPEVFDFVKVEPVDYLGISNVKINSVDRKSGKIVFDTSIDQNTVGPISGVDGALEVFLKPRGEITTPSEITFLPGTTVTAEGIDGNALVSITNVQTK